MGEYGTFSFKARGSSYLIRYRYHFIFRGNKEKKVLNDRPKVMMEVTEQNLNLNLVLTQRQRYCQVGHMERAYTTFPLGRVIEHTGKYLPHSSLGSKKDVISPAG